MSICNMYVYIYIYIYIYTHVYLHIHMYLCIPQAGGQRQSPRRRADAVDRDAQPEQRARMFTTISTK